MVHILCTNKCCALQENVVSKQHTLFDQETTDQYVVDYCLDKQSGFSTAPAAQYCSVARERVKCVLRRPSIFAVCLKLCANRISCLVWGGGGYIIGPNQAGKHANSLVNCISVTDDININEQNSQ